MSNAQHPPFKVHMPIADHLFWMPVRCPVVSINGLWRVAINENGRPPYGGYCLKLLPLPSWGTITTNCETVILCGSCRMHPERARPTLQHTAELEQDVPRKQLDTCNEQYSYVRRCAGQQRINLMPRKNIYLFRTQTLPVFHSIANITPGSICTGTSSFK